MKYRIETWTVEELISTTKEGNLNLNPPYQRNAIWTKTTQKLLINNIRKGMPMPNIFLFQLEPNKFEMVDGQQRTRAIKLYYETDEINIGDDKIFKGEAFKNFEISVIIIEEVGLDESIEDFYYMVNTSGAKLNRPEENKAQYFNTKFLKLVEDLTKSEEFSALDIVPPNSQKRMMDRELVEELTAQILHGITDKKSQVDKIYVSDITKEDEKICRIKFQQVVDHLKRFNEIKPIKNTRYRQRNDFYTLFGLIKDNLQVDTLILDYAYETLLVLEKGILPSRNGCEPLTEYAFNCVSQSNSASARLARHEILNSLLLNAEGQPTLNQKKVQDFYPAPGKYFIEKNSFCVFDNKVLLTAMDEKSIE